MKVTEMMNKFGQPNLIDFPVRRRWLLIVSVGAIIFWLAEVTLTASATDRLREARQREHMYKQEYSQVSAQLATLNAEQLPLEVLEEKLAIETARFSRDGDIPALLEDISRIGAETGLVFSEFKPVELTALSYYTVLSVSVEIAGHYPQFIAFIDQLMSLPRIISMDRLQISAGEMGVVLRTRLLDYQYIEETL